MEKGDVRVVGSAAFGSVRSSRRWLAGVCVGAVLIAGAVDRPPASASAVRASACRAPAEPLAGVWGPSRLLLLAPCRRVSGRVRDLRRELDGDLTFDLVVRSRYRSLINAQNRRELHGALHVEFIPRDGGHLLQPREGDTVTLTGAWVADMGEGWNELHPVFTERVTGGPPHRSGPQFGGSPPAAAEYNAAELCLDQEGQVCQGYGAVLGRCLRVRGHASAYTDSGCTAAAGHRRFEWFPATGGRHPLTDPRLTTRIARRTTAAIETPSGTNVRCTGEHGGGVVGSRKALLGIRLALTGCTSAGQRCQSAGRPPGEVTTSELIARVGRLKTSGRSPGRNRAGISLETAPGVPLVQFACGGLVVTVRGSVIGLITANTMSRHQRLTFSSSHRRQAIRHFEHVPDMTLEASVGVAPPQPAALSLRMMQTSAQPVEINSAL
jgi:hypothetical protein